MKKSVRESFRPGAVCALTDLFEDSAMELRRLIRRQIERFLRE